MFELQQLEQLLAIKKYQTISKAAEQLNITPSALSRSIQRLEDELGVSLFTHQKNKLIINEDGITAAEYAKRILDLSQEMKNTITKNSKDRKTICIGSITPSPMWELIPALSKLHPNLVIQSEMSSTTALEKGLENGLYQLIITDERSADDDTICIAYCEESLSVSVPLNHPLASHTELSFEELDGSSILQYSNVGKWLDICKSHMPHSTFILQDQFALLHELRASSSLLAFASNLAHGNPSLENRTLIPLTDAEATIKYYLKYKKANSEIFENISKLTQE